MNAMSSMGELDRSQRLKESEALIRHKAPQRESTCSQTGSGSCGIEFSSELGQFYWIV